MLTLFVALYVLVYVECLVRRWLRALALLTWACLMVLGSVLMWDSLENEAYAWEQVMVAADVTGLGYQAAGMCNWHLLHTCAHSCTLVHTRAVGSWKWANTACSRGSPCRLWRRISDGPKLSLFSEECPLEYLPFWIEPVLLEMTEFQLKETKGINGLVCQEESSRAGPSPGSLETLAFALLYCPQVEAEMAAHLLS